MAQWDTGNVVKSNRVASSKNGVPAATSDLWYVYFKTNIQAYCEFKDMRYS